jgi:uncharacterized membrane protein
VNLWSSLAIAVAIAFGLKLGGHLVPAHVLGGPRVRRVTGALPVALLAALVATQALTDRTGGLVVDARAAAVGVSVVALLLRAPFIVVVVLGAATAASLRALGWG